MWDVFLFTWLSFSSLSRAIFLYGNSVVSWGCWMSSSLPSVDIGEILNAYRYYKRTNERNSITEDAVHAREGSGQTWWLVPLEEPYWISFIMLIISCNVRATGFEPRTWCIRSQRTYYWYTAVFDYMHYQYKSSNSRIKNSMKKVSKM